MPPADSFQSVSESDQQKASEMNKPLGQRTKFAVLSSCEQEVVSLALSGADSAADYGLCAKSDFPVGAGILAANDRGETRLFSGCNVENDWFPAAICAERSAATRSAFEGYKKFQIVAVFCRKFPGGSPCGLCRQVLVQFGRDATLLNVIDHDHNVRKALVGDLLPAASATPVAFGALDVVEQNLVKKAMALKSRSHVPYSQRPRAALFIAANEKGRVQVFSGVSDDNASYGASALAEAVAMRTARTAGFSVGAKLIVTVENASAVNPIEGECLQVLREFGADAPILLVGPDRSVVRTTLDELLPDSFGPEAL
jgi:cytidine deaminase